MLTHRPTCTPQPRRNHPAATLKQPTRLPFELPGSAVSSPMPRCTMRRLFCDTGPAALLSRSGNDQVYATAWPFQAQALGAHAPHLAHGIRPRRAILVEVTLTQLAHAGFDTRVSSGTPFATRRRRRPDFVGLQVNSIADTYLAGGTRTSASNPGASLDPHPRA